VLWVQLTFYEQCREVMRSNINANGAVNSAIPHLHPVGPDIQTLVVRLTWSILRRVQAAGAGAEGDVFQRLQRIPCSRQAAKSQSFNQPSRLCVLAKTTRIGNEAAADDD
jgi:hypothetical protein